MKKYFLYKRRGYVAIVSVLIIGVLIVTLGTTVTLTAINHLQNSFGSHKSSQALYNVENCMDELLYKLREGYVIPAQVDIYGNVCDVVFQDLGSNTYNFEIRSELQGYQKAIEVDASGSATIYINTWKLIQ